MDINPLYMDMPCRIKGFAYKIDIDRYVIAINTRLNTEQQEEAYLHELQHIKNNDFEKDDIDLIELLMSQLA